MADSRGEEAVGGRGAGETMSPGSSTAGGGGVGWRRWMRTLAWSGDEQDGAWAAVEEAGRKIRWTKNEPDENMLREPERNTSGRDGGRK